MLLEKNKAWIEINLNAIRHNYKLVESMLKPSCQIMPVIKADAYGLGGAVIGKLFEQMGASVFATANIDEAMGLRKAGIKSHISLLSPVTSEMVLLAAENNISIPLVSLKQAKEIDNILNSAGKKSQVSIKLDSGLGRLGIYLAENFEKAIDEAMEIFSLKNVHVEFLFAHITSCKKPGGEELDRWEIELFDKAKKTIQNKLGKKIKSHCLSSTPFLDYPEYDFDYARMGTIFMIPSCPKEEELGFKHSVSIKCRILQIKELPKGAPISYGPEFVTIRPTRIAIVPLGYSAGLRRSLSNRGHMLLHGKKAPIIGKICCDYTILDVTDIKEAKENDIAVLAGINGDLSQHIYDLAEIYPASIAEVTTGFNERIERVYLDK